jgi:hypothetical protein
VLTADLVRAWVRGNLVVPQYVSAGDPEMLDLAAALIDIFQRHVGRTRGELDARLKEFLGTGTAFLLHRGLAKLLHDRCEFQSESPVDPAVLRRAVFEAAARAHREGQGGTARPDRAAVLAQAAQPLALDPAQLDRLLYADLKEEQVLQKCEPYPPARLLERYNLALAQAVLLRATELEVQVAGETAARFRELFRRIKFLQLLHEIHGSADQGYHIRLDGPLSLFQSAQKYGVQMAGLLPVLLHCAEWELRATVRWGPARTEREFRLSPGDGLRSHTPSTGQWQPPEMSWLPEQFAKLQSDWQILTQPELLELGGTRQVVVVPDHVFEHRPSGWRVYLEIFGFWRRGALDARLAQLAERGCDNLLLAVSRELHVGEDEPVPHANIYVFRSVPIAADVLLRLDEMRAGHFALDGRIVSG